MFHLRRDTKTAPAVILSDDDDKGDSKPRPDPTSLTTAQMLRQVEALRELMEAKFDGSESVIFERFRAVEQRFIMSESQRVEQKLDTQTAVAAALQAQKEAVAEQTNASGLSIAKSEAATSKQLDQLSTTFSTAIQGVTLSFSDLKERVSRIENVKQGGKETIGAVYAFVGFLAAMVLVVGFIFASGANP